MKHISKIKFLFLVLFSTGIAISDSKIVYNIASKSVFKITALDAFNNEIRNGFGVAIGGSKCKSDEILYRLTENGFGESNKDGVDILTSFHNISYSSRIFVESKNGDKCEAAIVYLYSPLNIAIIRTNKKLSDTYPHRSTEVSLGKKVFIYYFSDKNNETLREIYIDELKSIKSGSYYFKNSLTNRIVGVSIQENLIKSGAGVFDENGFFIGIYRGQNAFDLKENSIINIDERMAEIIKKSNQLNIDLPGNLYENQWSVGIYYLENFSGDISKSLAWRNTDLYWSRWNTFESAKRLLQQSRSDDFISKLKGKKSKSESFNYLSDSISALTLKRSLEFEYDIEGKIWSLENLDSKKDINNEFSKLNSMYGEPLIVSIKKIELLYESTPKNNILFFKNRVLEFIKNCPKYSNYLPVKIQSDIYDFKRILKYLPTTDYDKSIETNKSIEDIIGFFEILGWKENY
jgi:hypothetical protein